METAPLKTDRKDRTAAYFVRWVRDDEPTGAARQRRGQSALVCQSGGWTRARNAQSNPV
jgi:hypothetical protein